MVEPSEISQIGQIDRFHLNENRILLMLGLCPILGNCNTVEHYGFEETPAFEIVSCRPSPNPIKTENMLNRKHQTGMMALEYSYNQDLLSQQEKGDLMELLGTWVISWARSS